MTDEPLALEAVFLAANVREAARVERLLEDAGIEYEVTPEAFVRGTLVSSCRMGLLFEVLSGQAGHCRRLFERADLLKGIVPPPEELMQDRHPPGPAFPTSRCSRTVLHGANRTRRV